MEIPRCFGSGLAYKKMEKEGEHGVHCWTATDGKSICAQLHLSDGRELMRSGIAGDEVTIRRVLYQHGTE